MAEKACPNPNFLKEVYKARVNEGNLLVIPLCGFFSVMNTVTHQKYFVIDEKFLSRNFFSDMNKEKQDEFKKQLKQLGYETKSQEKELAEKTVKENVVTAKFEKKYGRMSLEELEKILSNPQGLELHQIAYIKKVIQDKQLCSSSSSLFLDGTTLHNEEDYSDMPPLMDEKEKVKSLVPSTDLLALQNRIPRHPMSNVIPKKVICFFNEKLSKYLGFSYLLLEKQINNEVTIASPNGKKVTLNQEQLSYWMNRFLKPDEEGKYLIPQAFLPEDLHSKVLLFLLIKK